MKIKKPENFEDILNLQKELDKNINSIRLRGLKDIKKSLIAECIKFDEESKDTHKTWKKHNYNKEKELDNAKREKIKSLIEYLDQNNSINNKEAQNLLDISELAAKRFLNKLVKENILEAVGEYKARKYIKK